MKFSSLLISLHYKQSASDHSLFIHFHGCKCIIILIFVDDLIISGNNIDSILTLKTILNTNFKIKDLCDLRFFLSLEVMHSPLGISICQRKYALELIHDTCLLISKPSPTSMTKLHKYKTIDDSPPTDATTYRRLIGRLIYLCTTRSDLSFNVQQLSQFMSSPMLLHLQASHRVLRYFKQSPSQGLFFSSDSTLQLKAFSDSDWASCNDTRRSIICFNIFLRG